MPQGAAGPYRTQMAVCVALATVGVGVLAIPAAAEGRILVPISEGHGLSTIDAVGTCLLVAASTWMEVLVIRRLPHLGLTPRALFGAGLLAGLGIGLVIASVFSAFFWWWAVGAVALGVVALSLIALTVIR